MSDEEKVVEAGAEAPVDEAPPAEAGDEGAPEKDAPRVAVQVEDPAAEIRFTRRTVWNVGTADGATKHVFEDGDEVELPQTVALVFVGMGAAVWSGDTEVAVKAAGEKATRSRGRRK